MVIVKLLILLFCLIRIGRLRDQERAKKMDVHNSL
jgi:hypothetical protein